MRAALQGIVVILLLACRLNAEALTEQKFEELHKELRPPADELWRTIPWNISLIEAQHLAANERKLLFIWAMDGHPLGCT